MQDNKSICFLLPGWITKHIGGAELQCYLLSEELLNRGWNVEVLTMQYKNTLDPSTSKYFNANIHYIYFKNLPNILINIIRLITILLNCKSKYLYVRTETKTFQTAASICSKISNKKVIYALASDDELIKKSFFTLTQLNKNTNFFKLYYLIESYFADLLFKKFNYNVDLILVQTLYQQIQLRNKYQLNSKLIQNSVHFDDQDDTSEKENIILWIGFLRRVKQPEKIFKISNGLKSDNYKIVVIGNNSNYSRLIPETNNKIQFIGEQSYENTLKYMRKAKILINTSLTEGFPNTFIQAWFYKVHIVSLNVNPDGLFTNNTLGFFAEGNDKVMIEYLNAIINGEISFETIIKNAYSYCSENFKLSQNVDKLETFLNAL